MTVPVDQQEVVAAFREMIERKPNISKEDYGYDSTPLPADATEGQRRQVRMYNQEAFRNWNADNSMITRHRKLALEALAEFEKRPYNWDILGQLMAHLNDGRVRFDDDGKLEHIGGQVPALERREQILNILRHYNAVIDRELVA